MSLDARDYTAARRPPPVARRPPPAARRPPPAARGSGAARSREIPAAGGRC